MAAETIEEMVRVEKVIHHKKHKKGPQKAQKEIPFVSFALFCVFVVKHQSTGASKT
jgi:hypothetical protein